MQLVRYDAARHALQVAHSVDEAKEIRDQAAALEAYARQRNDVDMERWVAEIKLRATVRIGEISAQLDKHPQASGGRVSSNGQPTKLETLKAAGLSHAVASRAEKLAANGARERVEEYIERAASEKRPVTIDEALRVASGKPHVSHNSGENEWYTPPDIIERARKAMGAIDCDPASSQLANKNVKADIYYTAKDDGLEHKWKGRVWLNPPYAQPLCSQFCGAVTYRYLDKEIEQACVLVNNATETAWFQGMLRAANLLCLLEGRVKFIDKAGNPTGAPLQGQAVIYFGPRVKSFVAAFSNAGQVFAHSQ